MNRRHSQNGQALILVTLALVAMCGLLGLAVDLGWSFYVKKNAQTAADEAALAAVSAGKRRNPTGPPYACGTSPSSLFCATTPTPCSSISNGSNLYSACLYAKQQGFTDGVGNVRVTVASGIDTHAPTVPGITVAYWVTVRVNQQIPQLFSAVLGNSTGLVSARATAALTNVVFGASLYLLDRQNDTSPNGTGVDINIQGGGNVQANGGVFIASNVAGTATVGGSGTVTNTPFTDIRGDGTCTAGSGRPCSITQWNKAWSNGYSDGPQYWDPTSGKTQPPVIPPSNEWPVKNGDLNPANICGANPSCGAHGSGTQQDPYSLPPGKYYSVDSGGNATGAPLRINGAYTNFNNNGSAFGSYMFFGGLQTSTVNENITFAPGQYVMAGTQGGAPSVSLDLGTTIQDKTPLGGIQSDSGEMFIFTDVPNPSSGYAGYPGMSGQVPSAVNSISSTLGYGPSGFSFKNGNNNNSGVTLHGLNDTSTSIPSTLESYAPYLLWQDRNNSHVAYDANGNIVTSGGCATETGGVASIDNPCTNPRVPANSNKPQMNLWSTPKTQLSGAVYQPRGAWINFQGTGNIGPLQVVTGALTLGGTPTVPLSALGAPIKVPSVALIE